MQFDISLFAAIGFLFAAYAVVGNDALQTLGTFINSNKQLHWSIMFAFAATILIVTFTYGWVINEGDPSWGRLAKTSKYPVVEIQWYHTLPPLILLIITRFGVPVSTSFMVLTVFATLGGMSSMLQKSLIGYGLAFLVGGIVYVILSNTLEKVFRNKPNSQHKPIWVVLQWITTGYLWSVWLIQDFANIFVFLPRELSALECFAGLAVITALLGYTFANKGGPVQKILQSKTAVTDIRSATIIDFIYASLLFYFKELNDIPMSTTFVFLGLIAGREYAFAFTTKIVGIYKTAQNTLGDISKAYIGLVLSLNMALGLPFLARSLEAGSFSLSDLFPNIAYCNFIIIANLLIIPVVYFLKVKSTPSMITLTALLGSAVTTFFLIPLG